MEFSVDLQIFSGPLDLLLYLVRKHEVAIEEIPIAEVADQFLRYLEVVQQLDVDAVGDFLEVASTLIEIKSRLVLPHAEGTDETPLDDPRQELVERLLEYKKFRDAAGILEERARLWQDRFPRQSAEGPPGSNAADGPVQELELWDLVSAFGRILRENQAPPDSNIVYDDTPIQVFMQRIEAELESRGRLAFSDLFRQGMHKSTLIGLFLAVLELIRHRGIRAEQSESFSEIELVRLDGTL